MLSVRVHRKWHEADAICGFELVDPGGRALPRFTAGAHIDVQIGDGLVRQYSICNSPSEDQRYVIAVLHDANSKGGSRALHEVTREGDRLAISPPRNHFPLVPARKSLLLAGGIGVTPILCMAEHLSATGAAFEMHYCTRSQRYTAFRERIADARFARQVQFHYDDGPAEQRLDLPSVLGAGGHGTHLYVCGPKGFIEAAVATARAQGYPENTLHREYFSAATPRPDANAAFQIIMASTGSAYVVPHNKTIVEILRESGIKMETCCNEGVCGACLTTVLAGEPDHRDSFLSDEERTQGNQITPCCSRAKSNVLVLDL